MSAEAVERFKGLVMDLELPREVSVLFGVICPYCGKNDRIRPLDPPESLKGQLPEEDLALYCGLWNLLAGGGELGGDLAACGFCRNVMALTRTGAVQALL